MLFRSNKSLAEQVGLSLSPAEAALLALLRRAMFSYEDMSVAISGQTDWQAVFHEAELQTVLPLTAEAAAGLPEALQPPGSVLARYVNRAIGQVSDNERIMAAQDEVLGILDSSSIPCAVLKGSSVAAYYPKPELRVQGDIDVLVGEGDLERAIDALTHSAYRLMPSTPSYDVKLYKGDLRVEVHRALSYIPPDKAGDFIRAGLSDALASTARVSLDSHTFPVLRDSHQALSLILHMRFHMLGGGLGLRQLCDYALFLHKVDKRTWEGEIDPLLRRAGLHRFASILAGTCRLCLGLPKASLPRGMEADEAVCAKVIADFFSSGNFGSKDPGRVPSSVLSAGRDKPNTDRFDPLNIIRNVNANARKNFPLCARYPVLLPAMWVYLPIRYFVRMKTGKRRYQPVGKILKSAREREMLFREFGLFQAEDERPGSKSRVHHDA